jgi:hypothetical protein
MRISTIKSLAKRHKRNKSQQSAIVNVKDGPSRGTRIPHENKRDSTATKSKVRVKKIYKERVNKTRVKRSENKAKEEAAQAKKIESNKVRLGRVKKRRSKKQKTPPTLSAVAEFRLFNDAIADRAGREDIEAETVITETHKDKIFQQLMISVPAKHRKSAAAQKKDISAASKNFGKGRVIADKGKWKFSGLRTPLYHHQLLGVDFMVEQECRDTAPKGG